MKHAGTTGANVQGVCANVLFAASGSAVMQQLAGPAGRLPGWFLNGTFSHCSVPQYAMAAHPNP